MIVIGSKSKHKSPSANKARNCGTFCRHLRSSNSEQIDQRLKRQQTKYGVCKVSRSSSMCNVDETGPTKELIMNLLLRQLFDDVCFGEAISHGRLALIPLRLVRRSDLEYLLFDDKLAAADVRIEELSAAGSVSSIRVRNRAKHRVFLPDGTMLIGCKQNRVVNVSIMLAAESDTEIPVSCVERGRWQFATTGFSPAEHCDGSLRQKMCARTSDSLKSHGMVSMDQSAVWDHVELVLGGFGAASPTRAYHAAYEKRHEQLAEYESRLQYPADASGIAVALDGLIREIEVFDRPTTLQKLWARLVRSYAVSALSRSESCGGKRDAMNFFEQAVHSDWCPFASVGEGTTLRLTTKDAVGAALLCDEHLVHMSLFSVN
jgi:hypothetical protein